MLYNMQFAIAQQSLDSEKNHMYGMAMGTGESFGSLVRRYRQARGMTVQELADMVSSDKSTISRIENDKTEVPTTDLYYRLIGTLGIDELDALRARGLYRGVDIHAGRVATIQGTVDRIAALPAGTRMAAMQELRRSDPEQYNIIETLFRDWLLTLVERRGTERPAPNNTRSGRPETDANGQQHPGY